MDNLNDLLEIFTESLTITDIFSILFVLFAVWLANKIVDSFLHWAADRLPKRSRLTILMPIPILQIFFILAGLFIIVVQILQPAPDKLWGILAGSFLAIGFAFQEYISSIIAAVVSIYERPYQIGDWISFNNSYGEVKEINLRSVTIRTLNDTLVIIPHKLIWSQSIANDNSGASYHLCLADFYLHPNHDAEQIRYKLYDVLLTSPYIRMNSPVMVRITEEPWGTHYQLKGYPVDSFLQVEFSTDLTIRGKEALNKLGVQWATTPLATKLN